MLKAKLIALSAAMLALTACGGSKSGGSSGGSMSKSFSQQSSCLKSNADFISPSGGWFCIDGRQVIAKNMNSYKENGKICRLGSQTVSPFGAGTLYECNIENDDLILYACDGYSSCSGPVRRNIRGKRRR